ncbi:ABC transporter permease [Actinomycetaceae bacterium MB13-C1-2]|nr:ABC transporter permease [Actinomycetaceae bacterium MB13-C1-2]
MTNALTLDEIRTKKPIVGPTKGLARFTYESFLQIVFNPFNLGFALLMPVLMYMMFGANQPYSDYAVGNGNVAAQVLVSMTLFGVLLTTASFAANVSLERTQGVSRLYALTPLTAPAQLAGRMVGILGVALVVILLTFTVGFFTGASMTLLTWIISALVILVVSAVAVACGFGFGFAVRSDGAFAAVSAVIVLSAFGAGMAIPLEQLGGFFQQIAPWTPLWGASQLALLPMLGWEELSFPKVLSFVLWTAAFGMLAVWGLRRDTRR